MTKVPFKSWHTLESCARFLPAQIIAKESIGTKKRHIIEPISVGNLLYRYLWLKELSTEILLFPDGLQGEGRLKERLIGAPLVSQGRKPQESGYLEAEKRR
jgi:hypothetical protein